MKANKTKRQCYLLAVVTFLLYLLVVYLYWPAIHGGLVWDDPTLVQRHSLLNVTNWFHNSFGLAYLSDAYYYRPLPLLTLIWNGMAGAEHFVFTAHVTNVVIFCLNLTLVMVLVFNVSSHHTGPAILTGLLYAVHPALIESVAWIAGRCDLLLTFFILLAFYFDIMLKNHFKLKITLVALCFLCAALSKETAIIFPALFLGWKLYIEKIDFNIKAAGNWLTKTENQLYFLFIAMAGIVYLAIRISLLGSLFGEQAISNHIDNSGGIFSHLLLVTKTFYWYCFLQLFPHYDLSVIYHTNIPVAINDHAAWYGFVLLTLLFILLASKQLSSKNRYALLILILLFLPIANLKVVMAWDNFIYLRFLTLPISCLMILSIPAFFNWTAAQRIQRQIIIVGGILIWWVGSMANVAVTVPLWSHELYLWKWTTETKADSYLAWDNYASALQAEKEFGKCIAATRESIARYPKNGKPYVIGAQCAYELSDFQQSQNLIRAALNNQTLMDNKTSSALLTTFALLDMKNTQGTPSLDKTIIAKLSDAISQDATNHRAKYLLIAWYIRNGEKDLAEQLARENNKSAMAAGITSVDIVNFIASEKILDIKQEAELEKILATID